MDDERRHEEVMELLGAYALDAVGPDERAAVETHLATCARCATEVDEHREVAAQLANTGAPAPEGVWSRIVESLEEAPPSFGGLPAREGDGTSTGGRRSSMRWVPLAAAAAVLVVVSVVAGLLVGGDDSDQGPADVAQVSLEDVARQALNDPDAVKVPLTSPDDADVEATAVVEGDGSGYLLGTSLPALDESQTYQLWGVGPDAVVSLGVLGHTPGVVAFHLDDSIDALVVTAEVAGGVAQSQNAPVVAGDVS